jgi:hypothetical protein
MEDRQDIRNPGSWTDVVPVDIFNPHPHSKQTVRVNQEDGVVFQSAEEPFPLLQMLMDTLPQSQVSVSVERPYKGFCTFHGDLFSFLAELVAGILCRRNGRESVTH